jgi:hypothetical protein
MEREMMDTRSGMERLQKDKQKLSIVFKRRLDVSQNEIVRLKKELAQALIAVEQQKKLAARERMLREDVERYTKSVVGKFSTLVAGDDEAFLSGMGDLGSAGILGSFSPPASAPSRSPRSPRGSGVNPPGGGGAIEMRGSHTPKTTGPSSSTLSISALSSQSQHGPPSRKPPSKPRSDDDEM